MARAVASKKGSVKQGKKSDDSKKSSDDTISAAEKRADQKQKERDQRTGERYLEQARNLNPQATALLKAVGEMKQRRKKDIRDIQRTRATTLEMLLDSAADSGEMYDIAAENNEFAAGAALESGVSNAVRERSEAMNQILTQGAGETDAMRAMLMAARNQNANANEVNRAYWDTIASINQNITSLNEETQAKMADAWVRGEGEKEQIWRDYIESTSDAYIQTGQVRTAQADALANAKEYEVDIPRLGKTKDSKGVNSKLKKWSSSGTKMKPMKLQGSMKNAAVKDKGVPGIKFRREQAKDAFDTWSELQDDSYKQKKIPKRIREYEGKELFEGRQSNSELAGALTVGPMAKAEGATLRKWV